MSDYFRNARHFSIGDYSTFNTVNGDQFNHTTIVQKTTETKRRLWIKGSEEEETEFAQYDEVKRGNIRIVRYIHRSTASDLARYCAKDVFTGEIARGAEKGSRLTVVSYTGRDARVIYSGTTKAQLLAINRSKIPLLLFTGDLVPARDFMKDTGPLGQVYFWALSSWLGCGWHEIWIDPSRGEFCVGPWGPEPTSSWFGPYIKNIPSSVELLKEEVCFRFLAGCKSRDVDWHVTVGLSWTLCRDLDLDFGIGQPTVISASTGEHIAVGTEVWNPYPVADRGHVLDTRSGLKFKRFILDEGRFGLWFSLSSNTKEERAVWPAQAWRVFQARGVSLESGLSDYKLVVPNRRLNGTFSGSDTERQLRSQQPIYLFIRSSSAGSAPFPLESCTTSSLHYWSFREDGQASLSADVCAQFGLPTELELEVYQSFTYSWSNEAYETIKRYQIARGFDPSTDEFAKWLGFEMCEIGGEKGRFEEVDD
ncbi:hypothetical protein V5O48_012394, partial [Marasmius crinis-equi]